MQAIRTKHIGPTNTRPRRMQAQCEAGRVVVSYDHELDGDDNHMAVCQALVAKLEWTGAAGYSPLVGGFFDGCMYWVFTRNSPLT